MTFAYNSPLNYVPPVADAGQNVVVTLPNTTAVLDGSLSKDPEGETITYSWEQIYGPSTITFSDNKSVSPSVSNLVEGVYKCKLTISDGTYEDSSDVLIIVSSTGNSSPSISITSPSDGAAFRENDDITISTITSDLDGSVALVEFYSGDTKIGEDTTDSFKFTWSGASIGNHQLTAVATR